MYSVRNFNNSKCICNKYICFNQYHQSRKCSKRKPCVHCEERKLHHRSLCFRKFVDTTDVSKKRENADSEESGLVSFQKKIVMQVEALNTENATFMETRLLLDSGSKGTCITKVLSDKPCLEPVGKETLIVCTFGKNQRKLHQRW